jgi:cytochrome c oxidase assembly protein Cox11
MPVYYFIQPDLPEHIKELTLSYTFFRADSSPGLAKAAPLGGSTDGSGPDSRED